MKRTVLLAAALLVGSATHALASDHDHHGHAHGEMAGEMRESRHEVRGIYLGYDAETHRISVAHEAIPEVMGAMRMNLKLIGEDAPPALVEGEQIRFAMVGKVEGGMVWYAESIETLPADTALELPESLREMSGHGH